MKRLGCTVSLFRRAAHANSLDCGEVALWRLRDQGSILNVSCAVERTLQVLR
jgi:hypothetical protein